MKMDAWLALIDVFGVHKLPLPMHYWSTRWILETRQFRQVMSRNYFQQNKACLHVSNELLPLLCGQLPKIGSFLDKIERRYQEVYYPAQKLAFGVMMVKFELDHQNGKKIENFVVDNCSKLQAGFHRVYLDKLFTSPSLFKSGGGEDLCMWHSASKPWAASITYGKKQPDSLDQEFGSG